MRGNPKQLYYLTGYKVRNLSIFLVEEMYKWEGSRFRKVLGSRFWEV